MSSRTRPATPATLNTHHMAISCAPASASLHRHEAGDQYRNAITLSRNLHRAWHLNMMCLEPLPPPPPLETTDRLTARVRLQWFHTTYHGLVEPWRREAVGTSSLLLQRRVVDMYEPLSQDRDGPERRDVNVQTGRPPS